MVLFASFFCLIQMFIHGLMQFKFQVRSSLTKKTTLNTYFWDTKITNADISNLKNKKLKWAVMHMYIDDEIITG